MRLPAYNSSACANRRAPLLVGGLFHLAQLTYVIYTHLNNLQYHLFGLFLIIVGRELEPVINRLLSTNSNVPVF